LSFVAVHRRSFSFVDIWKRNNPVTQMKSKTPARAQPISLSSAGQASRFAVAQTGDTRYAVTRVFLPRDEDFFSGTPV
jgi:hypothetical protein